MNLETANNLFQIGMVALVAFTLVRGLVTCLCRRIAR